MTTINRSLALCYGALCYLALLAAFLYAIGFVGDIGVPRSVDMHALHTSARRLWWTRCCSVCSPVQHSVMARPAFKRRWARIVPGLVERSTYVLIASSVLFVLYWQ